MTFSYLSLSFSHLPCLAVHSITTMVKKVSLYSQNSFIKKQNEGHNTSADRYSGNIFIMLHATSLLTTGGIINGEIRYSHNQFLRPPEMIRTLY